MLYNIQLILNYEYTMYSRLVGNTWEGHETGLFTMVKKPVLLLYIQERGSFAMMIIFEHYTFPSELNYI